MLYISTSEKLQLFFKSSKLQVPSINLYLLLLKYHVHKTDVSCYKETIGSRGMPTYYLKINTFFIVLTFKFSADL